MNFFRAIRTLPLVMGTLIPFELLAESPKSTSTPPVAMVVGISPHLERSAKDDVYRRIVGLLVQELPGGSSLTLVDADHLTSIANVEIPTTRAFQNERTRVNQFQEPILRLRDFLAHEPAIEPQHPSTAPAAIRVPQYLEFVAEHYLQTNRAPILLLLGHPLYLDSKEPSFSMLDGYFPGDGHLQATREQSIYGIRGRSNALPGIQIHWGYFGDPWLNDLHRERVQRFWSLFIQGQGGRLATFTSDLATVFRSSLLPSGQLHPPAFNVDPNENRIVMWRMNRETGQTDWITRDSVGPNPAAAPATLVGPMRVGIRWQGTIDLDLYARSRPGAETLYFQHPRSPEGYYSKDHRTSPDHDYEYIEFETPVDAREVEASVNFHTGTSEVPVTGEIRIEFDHRIYSGIFEIASRQGNEGRGGPDQQAAWARMDVSHLLHLDPTARHSASTSGTPAR